MKTAQMRGKVSLMVNSMTGFASGGDMLDASSWTWEIRSVNGRGLDVRTRLPEGFDGLEKTVKSATSKLCARGTINIGLRLKQSSEAGVPTLNITNLDAVIEAVKNTEDRAADQGLSLAVTRAGDLLGLRGVMEMTTPDSDNKAALLVAISDSFHAVLVDFGQMRGAEGASLQNILQNQVGQIADLVAQSKTLTRVRADKIQANFRDNLARIVRNVEGVDEDRIAQELAILAVKSDIIEELDRLDAHVEAAYDLLDQDGAIGRKFDFLTQEFNREANTLCSKAGFSELTQVGLELKTVIDQMREQVQNVE